MPLRVIAARFEKYVRGDIVKEKDEERFRAHYPRLVEEMPEPAEDVGVAEAEEPSPDTTAEPAPKHARESTRRR